MDSNSAGLVTCQTSQGTEIRGSVVRLTRHHVLFETYNASAVLKLSEVLSDFKILVESRHVYSGRAVVSQLLNAGAVLVCEATLEETWVDIDFFAALADVSQLPQQFTHFIQSWQKTYKVAPDYKLIIADMQSFFMELRWWLEQVELGIRSSPTGSRIDLEREVTKSLAQAVLPCIDELFNRFEAIAAGIEKGEQAAHANYMRRQLHPLILCSPFAYRTFSKPLGYAGDYEMVNMMNRDPSEGSTLFAKMVNRWFWEQRPAKAHRNRLEYLASKILEEVVRIRARNKVARILNLGCGPALEVQRFLKDHPELGNSVEFMLIDFNDETLQYVEQVFDHIKRQQTSSVSVQIQKRSVQQILKEAARSVELPPEKRYDFIYCAGLFDYLPDPICLRLMSVFHGWLAADGLLLATNVDPSNPMRHGMEHLLDWHLVYRDNSQARKLKPQQTSDEVFSIIAEPTGVNIFLELRKTGYG